MWGKKTVGAVGGEWEGVGFWLLFCHQQSCLWRLRPNWWNLFCGSMDVSGPKWSFLGKNEIYPSVSYFFSIKSLILQVYYMCGRKNHEVSPGHSGSSAPNHNCYSFLALRRKPHILACQSRLMQGRLQKLSTFFFYWWVCRIFSTFWMVEQAF